MDELSILSKFDSLVESGIVVYDDKQDIIEYADGDLKVGIE
jgi:ATP adenylyltransferase